MALQRSKKEKEANRSTQPTKRGAGEVPKRASPSAKQLDTKSRPSADKRTHRLPEPVGRRTRCPEHTPIIFTVGHSTRAAKEFVALLLAHDVRQLIDVRTIPRSRHNPQFNRDRLPRPLKKAGIRYRPMAALGGLRHARRDSKCWLEKCELPRVRRLHANSRISKSPGSVDFWQSFMW